MTKTAQTPRALDKIVQEHKTIAATMDVLDREITALEQQGRFDADLVRLVLSYMAEYPDRFHHPHEEILFELAADKDPGFAVLAAGVRRDHGTLPAATARFTEMLDGIELGSSMPRDAVLAEAKGYVTREREHMQQENDLLFPALLRILSPEEWETAAERIAAVDDPLHGGSDPGPYRRLQELIHFQG